MQNYTPQKTFVQRKEDGVRGRYHVDASEEILGRMASGIANILMGKNKPTYTAHVDGGDYVVVTNAKLVLTTGAKRGKTLYHYHTGYLGGLRSNTMEWMIENKPEEVVRLAVRRMLPKSRLGRKMLSKLKVFPGAEHDMDAQAPHFEKIRITNKS